MAKFSFAVLLLSTINVGNYYVRGQSTVGDCNNDERDLQHNSDALAKSIQSEFQNLKAQISRLENRVESRELPGSRCPNGFNYTATAFPKCYAVLRQAAKWYGAQQKCRQLHEHAHLAVINGPLEQQIISQILQNYDCLQTNTDGKGYRRLGNYFWVGGQLRNVSDCSSQYTWKPGNWTSLPIVYSNWYAEEPNCFPAVGLIENCIGIRPDGQWNDLPCSWNFCSVCEVTVYT